MSQITQDLIKKNTSTSIVPKPIGTAYSPDKGPTGPAAENPILQRSAPGDASKTQAQGSNLRSLIKKLSD